MPNGANNVVGIVSDSSGHTLGEQTGSETITLSIAQLPSHAHYLVNDAGDCEANSAISNAGTYPYMSYQCADSGTVGDSSRRYSLARSSQLPNTYVSGYSGSYSSINIMQPTIYAGNLFVYAG